MKLYRGRLRSPLGELWIVSDDQECVRALEFADRRARLVRLLEEHYGTYELIETAVPHGIATALQRYFDGELTALNHIATATGGSELQRRVWKALRTVPVGKTTTYGDIARGLGLHDPRAAIDIGAANGSNPVAIIVPCHRVIAKNGDLKGYAGGPHRKRWLLEHEGALPRRIEAPHALRLPGL